MAEVMEGVITIVQESRFQMTGDDGVSHMFILGPHVGAEADQLPALRFRARVRVEFDRQTNVIGNLATAIAIVGGAG